MIANCTAGDLSEVRMREARVRTEETEKETILASEMLDSDQL